MRPTNRLHGQGMSDEVAHCLAAGMDAYLLKPMDLTALMDELGRWLPLPGAGKARFA